MPVAPREKTLRPILLYPTTPNSGPPYNSPAAEPDSSGRPATAQLVLADWGDARASGSDIDRTKAFEFSGVKGQSVLVWFTQLPASQNNSGETKHFVDVTEVKVA